MSAVRAFLARILIRAWEKAAAGRIAQIHILAKHRGLAVELVL